MVGRYDLLTTAEHTSSVREYRSIVSLNFRYSHSIPVI